MKRLLFIISLSVFAAISISSASFAEEESGQALEIAPPLISLRADPGETIKTQISIRDISKGSLIVNGEVNDFGAGGEGGIPKISVESLEKSPHSITDWVEPLGQLALEPSQIEQLPITINVPANASPGGYYGVIRFTAKAGELDTSGVALSASIGALVFIRVNGDAKEGLEILELSASKDNRKGWFFDSKPIGFSMRVKNTGNVQEQPVGIVAVKDMFGNLLANLVINEDRNYILPDSVRSFDADYPLDETNIGKRVLFGLYTAELTTKYGENNQEVTQKITFFVLPWKIILGVIVLLAALIGGFRYWLHTHDQRSGKRQTGNRSRRRRR